MKRTLFLLISFYMGLVGANAQSNKYDLNEDWVVNITDVTTLVTIILEFNNGKKYDLNDDEEVNIIDVILLVNFILNQNNNLICPDNHHPHMILGLPSGTKCACCNVGATKPEEYGGYYAWGETEEKEVYNIMTYQYSTVVEEINDEYGDSYYVDKYGNKYPYDEMMDRVFGTEVDDEDYLYFYQDFGSTICGTQYDVAHVKWGNSWQMPSLEQFKELINNRSYIYVRSGLQFTGPNGNSIFLPVAFNREGSGTNYNYIPGVYRSGTLNQEEIEYGFAYVLSFLDIEVFLERNYW